MQRICRHYFGALIILTGLVLGGSAGVTRADDAPRVGPSSSLVVLNVPGGGKANIRATADPRSQLLSELQAGATGFNVTGNVQRYGDTWWVQVRVGTTVGWLNARLLADSVTLTPLQAFVPIDDLQQVADYGFLLGAYDVLPVTSFEECARRCMSDSRCAAIQYARKPSACAMHGQRPEVRPLPGFDVAAKPRPEPLRGWVPSDAPVYAKSNDVTFEADGYRQFIAHTAEECAFSCTAERQCSGYEYQRKKLVCALFNKSARTSTKAGYEIGARQSVATTATAPPPPPPPAPPVPTTAARPVPTASAVPAPNAAPGDYRSMAQLFQQLVEDGSATAAFASADIDRSGRVKFTPGDAPPGTPSRLEGTAHNLAALVDPKESRRVILVYYATATTPPFTVGAAQHATDAAAQSAARKLQSDLDKLAGLTNLGADPFASLKAARR